MKRIIIGDPLPTPNGFTEWVKGALRLFEQGTVDDIESVISEFTIAGTVTETRTLDVDTATLADLLNFVATMVNDIKKGGQKRSYGS